MAPRGLAVGVVSLLAVVATAAHADTAPSPGPDERVTFGIQTASATAADDRGRFSWSATPGARVTDHLAIINFSEEPLSLVVYPADGFTTPDGGYGVAAAAETPTGLGSWITMSQREVALPPRGRVIVPFTLKVPFGASPGDQGGGLVVSQQAAQTGGDGAQLAVDQRVALRTYVRVTGDAGVGLEVADLTAGYKGALLTPWRGGAVVSFTVRNTGALRVGAQPTVTVTGPFGIRRTAAVEPIPEILPGNEVRLQAVVADVPAAVRLTATVSVTPLTVDTEPATDAGELTFAQTGFWAIPWLLLALLLVIGASLEWLRRRRGRRAAPRHRAPAATAAPAPSELADA